MTTRAVRSAVACLLLSALLAATAAAQRGQFPWSAADSAPRLGGVRLGDRRGRVDSLLGSATRTQQMESGLNVADYDAVGMRVAYSVQGVVEAVFSFARGAELGGVRMGHRMRAVRAEWGAPDEVDGSASYYAAGTFAVLVRADSSTQRVVQLGLIAVPQPEPYVLADSNDVFTVVAGTWDWDGADGFCRDDPHTISFTPDRKFMIFTRAKPDTADDGTVTTDYRYEIRGHTRNSIRGFIIGEKRTTDRGELVVWDLVLMSPDSYRWHRTDWQPQGYTGLVVRCRQPAEKVPEPDGAHG